MIFLAAMADERWMGSMKMLSASDPEIMENLDSEVMEKLGGTDREVIIHEHCVTENKSLMRQLALKC